MRLLKRCILLPMLFFSSSIFAQFQYTLGYTAAWFYTNSSISGGLTYAISRNIYTRDNFSFSASTNLKIGIEDKAGSGVLIPYIVALLYFGNGNSRSNYNTYNNINSVIDNMDGGTIHLFLDVPLLLHFNYGLGSGIDCAKQWGFYLGGGFNYIRTGYTDPEGYSRSVGFMGCVADAGVRFKERIDINFSNTFALGQVGPMKNPVFSELTLALILGYGRR